MRRQWMNIHESEPHLARTRAEMETRWGCTHRTNRPTVCSWVFFYLLTLAVFQPSVSDIDVSHRGLRGVRMEGRSEREEIFVGRSHTHLLIAPSH